MINMSEITLTAENFENEVLKSDIPVLVDFWAAWCGPCRMVAPIVAQIAEEYEGRIRVGKVDVDQQPGIARDYRILSIPTLMVFKDGKVVNTAVGARPKEQIEALFRL